MHAQHMFLYSCELYTSKVLSLICLNSNHFLDIGANRGWYSCLLRTQNPNLGIYAFEPDSTIHSLLVDNLSQFSCTDEVIVIEQMGLGLRDGIAPLATYVEENDGMMTLFPQANLEVLSQQDVQILTLDSYFKMKLDSSGKTRFLLKIDVEGGEWDVIIGGRDFLTECRPVVVMEINSQLLSPANATSRMIFELMAELGYSSFWLDERGAISKVRNFDFPPHETLLGRNHGANYLFLPGLISSASAAAEWDFARHFHWNF